MLDSGKLQVKLHGVYISQYNLVHPIQHMTNTCFSLLQPHFSPAYFAHVHAVGYSEQSGVKSFNMYRGLCQESRKTSV